MKDKRKKDEPVEESAATHTEAAAKPAEEAAAKAVPAEEKTAASPAPDDSAKKIADLEQKVAETEKQRLLALAEMDNQRKRIAREMTSVRFQVTQDTLFPFLQVFDHFTMAVSAAQKTGTLESLLKGMSMIQAEFDKAFTELGVEKVDASGKKFDPNLHEAVAEEASDTVPAGIVIRQWSMGYKTSDKLLKPAMVVVSSGPAEKKDDKPESGK